MLSEESFPSLKKSIPASNNETVLQKPVLKYSDVLKQKKINVDTSKNDVDKEQKIDSKIDILINNISEKTEKFSIHESKSSIECNISKPQIENNISKNNKNGVKQNKEDIQKKYQNSIDSIVKIQKWWRMVSKIKSIKNISENKKEDNNEVKNVPEKKEKVVVKTIPKKPSFSDIKNQNKSKKVNEELNAIFKNMKFMGLIEKEIDDLTEKNTIVNGKQFAKTKVVTVKKFSRYGSSSSNFSIDDIVDNSKDSKKKGNKNENKTNDKKSHTKKNVCFNEKDEVFNEYNHVMKKLDLQKRCDKKSCLIDCYRRLYKREWEEEISEESSTSNSESEDSNENTTTTLKKKSDYLYNDIYNPNYTKYYSGSDFDFGNRYFTGKERLKKALHLEPVEVTVQKIIYQPIKFQKNKRYQQKNKKNNNKRKQKN
eukprot:jgi/Orpsp1_1/1185022/evm.model.c7180000092006.1